MGLFGKNKVISAPQQVVQQGTMFKIPEIPEIPTLPDLKDKTQLNVTYPLIAPYVNAHIYWDQQLNELVYSVEEPVLDPREKRILGLAEEGVRELINLSFINMKTPQIVVEYLEKNLKIILTELGIKITRDTFVKLMYYIYRDFVGLNELEPLMRDFFIEDVECNGINTPIYVVHRRYSNLRTNLIFPEVKKLTSFVEKLAQKSGKYISYASPLLDGSLPDGSRVNATYSQEISARGPTFTIRKFTREPWSPVQLMQFGTLSPELLAYLWILIENESNLMVIGGTGAGKTTLLNVLAFFIPPAARIVSIEDTRELMLLHENWLPSVARAGMTIGGAEKRGEVDLFALLKESFRQRPDYVIVGEIRGAEAYVLFQGMSSGHPSFGTMHAEDVNTMIKRLQTQPINLSSSLVETLDAVCVMTQVKMGEKMIRKVREVSEIVSVKDSGEAVTNVPMRWDPRTNKFMFKKDSKIFEKISLKRGIPKEALWREFVRRTNLFIKLYNQRIVGFKEVHDIVSNYYKTPQRIIQQFGL
ncbi:MAG: type II/IV secretion system ATPase subunit [Candidatus Nanoarchaeia archaeon]|nr:type II/IV secretion system ATPase subunit [Candidatus Nanoarchaeia archaeon]